MNEEERRAYMRVWRARNRDKTRRYDRRYRERHKERIRTARALSYSRNKEVRREDYRLNVDYWRGYYCRNKEKIVGYEKRKSARLRQEVFDLLGGKCAVTGETDPERIQLDHIPGCHPRNGSGRPVGGSQLYRNILDGTYPLSEWQLLRADIHQKKTIQERKTHGNRWSERHQRATGSEREPLPLFAHSGVDEGDI